MKNKPYADTFHMEKWNSHVSFLNDLKMLKHCVAVYWAGCFQHKLHTRDCNQPTRFKESICRQTRCNENTPHMENVANFKEIEGNTKSRMTMDWFWLRILNVDRPLPIYMYPCIWTCVRAHRCSEVCARAQVHSCVCVPLSLSLPLCVCGSLCLYYCYYIWIWREG